MAQARRPRHPRPGLRRRQGRGRRGTEETQRSGGVRHSETSSPASLTRAPVNLRPSVCQSVLLLPNARLPASFLSSFTRLAEVSQTCRRASASGPGEWESPAAGSAFERRSIGFCAIARPTWPADCLSSLSSSFTPAARPPGPPTQCPPARMYPRPTAARRRGCCLGVVLAVALAATVMLEVRKGRLIFEWKPGVFEPVPGARRRQPAIRPRCGLSRVSDGVAPPQRALKRPSPPRALPSASLTRAYGRTGGPIFLSAGPLTPPARRVADWAVPTHSSLSFFTPSMPTHLQPPPTSAIPAPAGQRQPHPPPRPSRLARPPPWTENRS